MQKILFLGIFVAALNCPATAKDLNLAITQCGGVFGGISPKFNPGIKSENDIDRLLGGIKWVDIQFYSDAFGEQSTIRKDLHSSFRILAKRQEPFSNIATPTGSEQFVANELYRLGVISAATRPDSYCAGSDESYFVISKKDAPNDLKNSRYFSDYIQDRLNGFVNSGKDKGEIVEGRTTQSPIPPKYPRKTMTLYVPGLLSRGQRKADVWDKFDLVFTLGLETKSYFVMLLYVDHLKSAPKRGPRQSVPSDEYFKRLEDDNSIDTEEFRITGIVAKFLAGSGSRCVVNSGPVTGEPNVSCMADDSIISGLR